MGYDREYSVRRQERRVVANINNYLKILKPPGKVLLRTISHKSKKEYTWKTPVKIQTEIDDTFYHTPPKAKVRMGYSTFSHTINWKGYGCE